MCGIIGIASQNNCIPSILTSLKSLEYRGYDSSGLASYQNNKFYVEKSVGKISNLLKKLQGKNLEDKIAIAHTRWATHGRPSIKNAHPFLKENCVLAHNGIIENFEELLKKYKLNKSKIVSDTDSEVIAEIYSKLLHMYNNPIEALSKMLNNIEGTFSFVFLVKGTKSIYATRKGSPLIVGLAKNFNCLSSDVLGLPDGTNQIIFLEENDIVEINSQTYSIFNQYGEKIKRNTHKHISKNEYNSKGKFKHFMQKEIFHQPISIEDTVLNFSDKKTSKILLPKCDINFKNVSNLHLAACGTAFHACMIAKYWLEKYTKIPTLIDIASEYRYREDSLCNNSVGIVVSQSGETMDTLECLKKFKQNGLFTASIVNVINSSIARESNYILPTLAGPEIGVASTKAFTSQLIVLALLTLHIQQQKKVSTKEDKNNFESLFDLTVLLKDLLSDLKSIESIAMTIKKSKSIFYIGRGTMYPLALEGALKLKEITYKHCEGYAAGELKHGPLALIEKDIPVIALAPHDNNFNKILSNIQEIKAREGKVILITDNSGAKKAKKYSDSVLILPDTNIFTAPIIYSIPIQMIAYFLAVSLGTDVDQPRNLAKSVTVE